ncbi:hypothetical protein BJX61DRAFT_539046 [Aspergillus egyptiacus]|nr:hypothetical protein BJX61DRAFT_539046 [Aspergillus egyptiacus]
MAPRRGGSSSFGGSSGSSGSSEYTVSACSHGGTGSWGLPVVITAAIFLGVYLAISLWHLVFMVKSRQIKGPPMLLRFRFGACLFCFFLSSFLETIYEGSHACGNMEFYDYLTGMIPSRIFLHVAWLFLVFVLLFPISRAIRVTRRMITPRAEKENKSKHTNKNVERTIQGILLIMMIIAITAHLFIHTLNEVEVRRYPPYDRKAGEIESYVAFPFLQLLAHVILLGVSKARLSGLGGGDHGMDLRLRVCSIAHFYHCILVISPEKERSANRGPDVMCAQRIKSRYNILMTILLLRSIFMITDTIVFYLVNTRSPPAVFFMYLIQKCFDALLLVYILLFTKSVRLLAALATADVSAAMTTTQTQVPTLASHPSPGFVAAAAYPAYLHSPFAQQPTSPGGSINPNLPSSTGQAMSPPAVPSAMYSGQGHPHTIPSPPPQPGEMQTQAPPLPQGQWVFIPDERVPAGQK